MNTEDIELKLLTNCPINENGLMGFHSPSIKKIISIGYSKYNQILSCLLFDKKNSSELSELQDSNFYLLCVFVLKDKNFKNLFDTGIEMIFDCGYCFDETLDGPIIKLDNGGYIQESNFSDFQYLIRLSNKLKQEDEEEYNPGNSRAKAFIEMIKKNKAKRPQKKPDKNLYSLISGLSWKSNSINILNISDLTIYQLYDGYHRMENIENYTNVFTGIYTGNIDSSKIKLQEIDWAKILN